MTSVLVKVFVFLRFRAISTVALLVLFLEVWETMLGFMCGEDSSWSFEDLKYGSFEILKYGNLRRR